MNKIHLILFVFISSFATSVIAQSFSDDFDTYTVGDYLAKTNTKWKTWSGTLGGTDDIKISNAKAKSGSNSLYFSGGTSGGPVDIVLPFGGQYNTGTMNLNMWMFVDNTKKAYINLQEQTTVGKGWSIDITFDSIGKFTINNTTSGTLLTGNYTQNTWMKLELQIDLNSNTWNFLVDGVSKGSFQNSYRQIASLNIYPVVNSSYYIDDVSYTYTPIIKSNLNGGITFIDNVTGRLAGVSLPSVEIRNLGTQPITSASIELTYNGTKQTKVISGLNIAYMATKLIPMDNSIMLLAGTSSITANLKLVNGVADDVMSDNTKTLDLNCATPALGKIVVAEEATGTWCQWCPRGAVWLEKLDKKYTGLFIGIAVHNNDPMMNDTYDNGIKPYVSGYPNALVDRGAGKDPSVMESDFLTQIMIAPKATMRNGAKYNSATKVLDVSITTKFSQPVTGNYKIAFVLVEDSVTGTTSKYNQSNAYAGGGSGVMGGYELLPNPVPASKMVYDHVARLISPNFLGLSNAFPNSVNAGDSFTHNFSITLDPTWKTKKLHVVGLLISPNRKIDNGSSAGLDEAIKNGYVTGTSVLGTKSWSLNINQMMVYPNPSAGNFTILIPEQYKTSGELNIYNAQGQLIQTENIGGNEYVSVNAQTWAPGLYIGLINSKGTVVKIKLIKE
ncbi:MAG: Omp28-related outer membrane protein [Bacteroidia bacterium]